MMSENEAQEGETVNVQGNKGESVLKEVWWVVRIIREAKVVGVRVWIMTLPLTQRAQLTVSKRTKQAVAFSGLSQRWPLHLGRWGTTRGVCYGLGCTTTQGTMMTSAIKIPGGND